MSLQIELASPTAELSSVDLDRLAKAFADLADSVGVINLALVDDKTIRELNKTYAGRDEVTDVLSFNWREDGLPAGDQLGDIAISKPTAARQARAKGISLKDELINLSAHGLLHLLGRDHHNHQDRITWDELLGRAGRPKQWD